MTDIVLADMAYPPSEPMAVISYMTQGTTEMEDGIAIADA